MGALCIIELLVVILAFVIFMLQVVVQRGDGQKVARVTCNIGMHQEAFAQRAAPQPLAKALHSELAWNVMKLLPNAPTSVCSASISHLCTMQTRKADGLCTMTFHVTRVYVKSHAQTQDVFAMWAFEDHACTTCGVVRTGCKAEVDSVCPQ